MESHPKMVGWILEFYSPWQFNCNANRDEILLVKYLPRPERLPWPVKLLYTGTGAAFVILYEECLWWNEIPSTLHPMCSDLEKFSSALKLMESQSRPKVTSFYNCCPLKTQILKLWRITGGNLPWSPSTLRKQKHLPKIPCFCWTPIFSHCAMVSSLMTRGHVTSRLSRDSCHKSLEFVTPSSGAPWYPGQGCHSVLRKLTRWMN